MSLTSVTFRIQPPAAWQAATNILCVRLDTLGDVLMTTPAIRALKGSAARRRITLLTSAAGSHIAALVPEIDDIIVYDAPWMKTTAIPSSAADLEMMERLRSSAFEAAVIFTVYSQSPLPAACMCYWAGIPLRLAHCRENPYALLSDWTRETEPECHIRHETRRQLDLVASVGARCVDERLSLRVPIGALAQIRQHLEGIIHVDRPWVVIHPGATAASRRYPAEHFATVGRLLVRELGCQVLFTGTGAERDLVETIQAEMEEESHSVVGILDLPRCAALIALAPLLISNNTGPVHMAAALGTPVVDLYALTNPQHTPWLVPHRLLFHDVPCKYCYKSVCPEGHQDCLRLVEPEAVVRAAIELLETRVLVPSNKGS